MKGKYPSALIFLDIDPAEIDVNVHPSKKIVKFANQSEIYDLVKGEIEKFFFDDENFISPHIEVEDEEVETFEKKEEKLEYSNNNFLDINDFKDEKESLSQLSVIQKEDYLKKDYSEIKVEKPNISHIENTVKTSSNEIKENIETFKKVDNDFDLIEKEVGTEKTKDKYIFDTKDTSRGKIFDDFQV